MINRFVSLVPALAVALIAHGVQAQSQSQSQPQPQSKPQSKPQTQSRPQTQKAEAGFLYKSTMPDGKVIYGDAPMPGATKVDKTRPDTSKKGITAATPKETEALRRLESERASSAAAANSQQATPTYTAAGLEAKLRELELAREKAKEPLPGERIGTAGGASRLTDAYWERQKRLDQSLDSLRKDIDSARSGAR
jgi:hypothetical protein